MVWTVEVSPAPDRDRLRAKFSGLLLEDAPPGLPSLDPRPGRSGLIRSWFPGFRLDLATFENCFSISTCVARPIAYCVKTRIVIAQERRGSPFLKSFLGESLSLFAFGAG
jgi:hypothetical protein